MKLYNGGVWKVICSVDVDLHKFGINLADLFTVRYSQSGVVWGWALDNEGVFLTSSLKHIICEKTDPVLEITMNWNKAVPIETNFLVWRASINRLPTIDNLRSRGVQFASLFCSTCGTNMEGVNHWDVTCQFARLVWSLVGNWCGLSHVRFDSLWFLLELTKSLKVNDTKKKMVEAVIMTTLWSL